MAVLGAPGSLMAVWGFLDFSLLVFGALSVAMSIVWGASTDALIKLTFSASELNAGLAIGIMLIITWVVSIGAIVQRPHVTRPLIALNWLLVVDVIAILVIGTIFYVATLPELTIVQDRFKGLSDAAAVALQDQFQCCGVTVGSNLTISDIFNTTRIGGSFCKDNSTIAATLNASSGVTCLSALVHDYDISVNNTFTVVYGFMAAVVPLLLASLCVIKKREESERFKKIDNKRGGRGFV